jgi:hypothetical protein
MRTRKNITGRLLAPLTVIALAVLIGCEQWGRGREEGAMPGNGDGQGLGNGMMNGDTADTARGDTAEDWMDHDTARRNGEPGMYDEMGMNGGAEKVTGTVAEINPSDSTVVIVDTVRIETDTEITKNGGKVSMEGLNKGDRISVRYETRNGDKIATEITGTPDTAAHETKESREPPIR